MLQRRIAVERHAVIAHPPAHAHADGGDLVLAAAAAGDPDADPPGAPLAHDAEAGEGADQPLLEIADIAAQVGPAALEVEHDIADPLARPVIGVLAAAAGGEHRKPIG